MSLVHQHTHIYSHTHTQTHTRALFHDVTKRCVLTHPSPLLFFTKPPLPFLFGLNSPNMLSMLLADALECGDDGKAMEVIKVLLAFGADLRYNHASPQAAADSFSSDTDDDPEGFALYGGGSGSGDGSGGNGSGSDGSAGGNGSAGEAAGDNVWEDEQAGAQHAAIGDYGGGEAGGEGWAENDDLELGGAWIDGNDMLDGGWGGEPGGWEEDPGIWGDDGGGGDDDPWGVATDDAASDASSHGEDEHAGDGGDGNGRGGSGSGRIDLPDSGASADAGVNLVTVAASEGRIEIMKALLDLEGFGSDGDAFPVAPGVTLYEAARQAGWSKYVWLFFFFLSLVVAPMDVPE